MIGKRSAQHPLFDGAAFYGFELEPGSYYAQLAVASHELFQDEEFEAFYSARKGRPSVPPSLLALVILMQTYEGVSDREAVNKARFDLRWSAVLGKQPCEQWFVRSTLELFRTHLVVHEGVWVIFKRSIEEARKKGLLKKGPLRVALDTKPVLCRGAVEDAWNLLATGIEQLCQVLAKVEGHPWRQWAQDRGFGTYVRPSVKGTADIDWSDKAQRNEFLGKVVSDGKRVLEIAADVLEKHDTDEEASKRVEQAAELLTRVLLQDIEIKTTQSGEAQATIKEGTVPDRMPSATDPEARHGRKSHSKRFVGHKASVVVDMNTGLVLNSDVLGGNAGDATDALGQVEQAEANVSQPIDAAMGDCAYGGRETRQAFAEAGRTLIAKVPAQPQGELFGKREFNVDVENSQVTCPAGNRAEQITQEKDGTKVFHFGAPCQECPLRSQCTKSETGRTVRMHPQEGLLQDARAYQATEAGKQLLGERVIVEHALARLARCG